MVNLLRNLRNFIQVAWAYKGIAWRDRDWDYAYLYYMLEVKLRRMERALKIDMTLTTDWDAELVAQTKRTNQSLRLCVRLLGNLVEGGYHERPFRRHAAMWGEAVRTMEPLREPETNEEPELLGSYRMVTTYPKATTPELQTQADEEMWTACLVADVIQERDRRNLFAIMGKYMPYWWD